VSLGELAMVVNSNFDKPLNEQARELAYAGSYLFVSSKSFIPDKTGWYKVIVVGAGGKSDSHNPSNGRNYLATGGSGGVSISTIHLKSSEIYPIEVTSTQSSFNNTLIATAGTAGIAYPSSSRDSGDGGTASGGDFNYPGLAGDISSFEYYSLEGLAGADVGVYIPELMRRETIAVSYTDSNDQINTGQLYSGYGILGYGASNGEGYKSVTQLKGGCVLIIPLELEE